MPEIRSHQFKRILSRKKAHVQLKEDIWVAATLNKDWAEQTRMACTTQRIIILSISLLLIFIGFIRVE